MTPEILWEAHLRRHDDTLQTVGLPPDFGSTDIELRATVPVAAFIDDWEPHIRRIPRPGDVLRGSGDLMTIGGGRMADGRRFGLQARMNVITGAGVPIARCHFARILIVETYNTVYATDAFPDLRLYGRNSGPWVPATRWDAFTLPIIHDGDLAALGALADAMEEEGDPLAGEVRDVWGAVEGHTSPRDPHHKAAARAICDIFARHLTGVAHAA